MEGEARKGGEIGLALDGAVGSVIGAEDILGVRNHKG